MFTGSEDQQRRSGSLGRDCALPLTRHPERKSRDPEEVSLKVPHRAPSVRAGLADSLRMTGGESAVRARAFTLLEIMLAVMILGMMSLAIYRFVQANVTAMRISSEADAAEARYDGLRELLTQQLQSLAPGTGALAGEPLRIDGHDRDELTWFCPAGPGLLTRYATGDFQVSLRLRAHDAKSRQLDLGLLRKPKEDTAVSNENETWVRLIDNVGTLQIRFFDSRLNTWVQRWTDTVTLPRLVKVVIGRTDSTAPTEITVPLARMPL
jgi:prepilin-type N-terminal cleavage/methylation domain-containing protein